MKIWIRIGDAGEYEGFDYVSEAAEALAESGIHNVERWIDGGWLLGFEAPGFMGDNGISCFFGDEESNLVYVLNHREKKKLEKLITAIMNPENAKTLTA